MAGSWGGCAGLCECVSCCVCACRPHPFRHPITNRHILTLTHLARGAREVRPPPRSAYWAFKPHTHIYTHTFPQTPARELRSPPGVLIGLSSWRWGPGPCACPARPWSQKGEGRREGLHSKPKLNPDPCACPARPWSQKGQGRGGGRGSSPDLDTDDAHPTLLTPYPHPNHTPTPPQPHRVCPLGFTFLTTPA